MTRSRTLDATDPSGVVADDHSPSQPLRNTLFGWALKVLSAVKPDGGNTEEERPSFASMMDAIGDRVANHPLWLSAVAATRRGFFQLASQADLSDEDCACLLDGSRPDDLGRILSVLNDHETLKKALLERMWAWLEAQLRIEFTGIKLTPESDDLAEKIFEITRGSFNEELSNEAIAEDVSSQVTRMLSQMGISDGNNIHVNVLDDKVGVRISLKD